MPGISHLVQQAVNQFGSQAKLAAVVGVAQTTVHKAIRDGRVGPVLAQGIHSATRGRISKSKLRPDLWPPKTG